MGTIRIAIAGIGNCTSALLQGIEFYRRGLPDEAIGLMHWDLGGYAPSDIELVAAWDVDERKVGKDAHEAIFAPPNCTTVFCPQLPPSDVTVRMGRTLDGVAEHMRGQDPRFGFVVAGEPEPDVDTVAAELKTARADMLLSYLPVGSEEATRFYAECALKAGVGFINNIPVFIASDPEWAGRFAAAGVPVIGDDIKSQVGATIVHRALTRLFADRGAVIDATYQLNFGGNTDFLNMLDRHRLSSKKVSKTRAVTSQSPQRLTDEHVHIGPSDWVPSQKDNKVAYIRLEGRLFGDVPMNLECRLSVEDSPNSAGVVIDAIRCIKLALDRGMGGVLSSASAYFMKHPPEQMPDAEAHAAVEAFIEGTKER